MNSFLARIQAQLDAQQFRGLNRQTRVVPEGWKDFTSNDYLGLARSEELRNAIDAFLSRSTRTRNGSGGSRLLSGNSLLAEEAERFVASLSGAPSGLLFSSGYMANLGVLSCIPQRGDTVLYDEHAHASLKDGIRLSPAARFSFRHNDLDDLERKIGKSKGTIFIVVESVYSMDGDLCPLADLVNLAQQHQAVVILDEAHGTGIFGSDGSGLATSLGLEKQIPIRILTFGKAMGIHGACVCCPETVRNYLVNFSRPFIYTTAMADHSLAAIQCSFQFLRERPELKSILADKINLFRKHCEFDTHSGTPIQPVIIGGNEQTRAAAARLQSQGYDVRPVLSPTVRPGTERLRICLHVYNRDEDIVALARAASQALSNRTT
ncbi:MAG TPA: 8-amino-7-oxononanoate synthase [Cyclobacteriaceae bacterium]|nr:8-amino-7-oxononanoate synthase [Cyclobacteriaceae bacterium]